jgi:hypothetical protein
MLEKQLVGVTRMLGRPSMFKGAMAGAVGSALAAASLRGVAAQDDDVMDDDGDDDVESSFTEAFVDPVTGDAFATSGDTTASVVDGQAIITTVEDEAEDDAGEDDDGGTDLGISADSGLSLADASGGDDNFAFVS